ncbi:hypothetical protein CPAR01_12804 [Colletotrichum paranaense]|uniref:Uncharacterized protein n=1 Tax=Colletotrichum paranaense TaxID=1914294 RepID=A0ABQ9S7G2_9PEZI|nr:uncharacterized protein CPAR01_12804 [Colletotrichum paranaense]KAK1528246.1 hypothetical protein CPAR01_12804 [Colletotrichum paranaense]
MVSCRRRQVPAGERIPRLQATQATFEWPWSNGVLFENEQEVDEDGDGDGDGDEDEEEDEEEEERIMACQLSHDDLEHQAWANVAAHRMDQYVKRITRTGDGSFNGRKSWANRSR